MASPAITESEAKDRRDVSALVVWAAAAVFIAVALYRPDRARPFDYLDFGEFVPVLKAAPNWWDQTTSLLRYNVDASGRVLVGQVLATTAKWQLFGSWTPGWQMAQTAVMIVVVMQSFVLLGRLGASTFGALTGSSVYLFAPAAARGYVRLTMAEPIAMVCILALALRATGFQSRKAWIGDVLWFAVTFALVILTKELMAPALLIPLALALTRQPDGSFALPVVSRRNVVLSIAVAITTIATLVPILLIFLQASPIAFASKYGSAMQSPFGILAIWLSTFVPFNPVPRQLSPMWAGAVAGVIALLAIGWWFERNNAAKAVERSGLWVASSVLPLVGVLSYAPWPAYEERYAFPYLIGPCLLFAIGATHLQRVSRKGMFVALSLWAIISAVGAADAAAYSSRTEAAQRTVDAVLRGVAEQPQLDSVFVATNIAAYPAWTGLGPSLSRLAAATDRNWPPTRDILCKDVARLVESRTRSAVVTFASSCSASMESTLDIARPHRYMDWQNWRVREDSVRASIFVLADHTVR